MSRRASQHPTRPKCASTRDAIACSNTTRVSRLCGGAERLGGARRDLRRRVPPAGRQEGAHLATWTFFFTVRFSLPVTGNGGPVSPSLALLQRGEHTAWSAWSAWYLGADRPVEADLRDRPVLTVSECLCSSRPKTRPKTAKACSLASCLGAMRSMPCPVQTEVGPTQVGVLA